jgi:hypothetical protein
MREPGNLLSLNEKIHTLNENILSSFYYAQQSIENGDGSIFVLNLKRKTNYIYSLFLSLKIRYLFFIPLGNRDTA